MTDNHFFIKGLSLPIKVGTFSDSLLIKIITITLFCTVIIPVLGLFSPIFAQSPLTSDQIENLLVDGMEKGIKGDYNGALAVFSRIISLDPQAIEAYYNRGIAYERIGRNRNAIADFNKVIDLNSNYAEAYLERGKIYLKLGQKQKAISDYQTALTLFEKQKNWPAYRWIESQLADLQRKL
jgi:Flp pilus assembly protein TadD